MLPFIRPLILCAVLGLFFFPAKAQIDSALFRAVKNCDLPEVQSVTGHCRDINATDRYGATALMWAVYYCDLPMVKYLAEKGAIVKDSGIIYLEEDKTKYYGNVTSLAAGLGKLDVLKYLLDFLHLSPDEMEYNPVSRVKNGWTPMLWAVYNGCTNVVNYLLQKGMPVDEMDGEGNTLFSVAADKGYWNIFELLMKKGGKEKLGREAEDFIYEAAALAKQDTANGKNNKELAVKKFIIELNSAWFGNEDFSFAASISNLAEFYENIGRHEEALPFYEQALAIYKKALGEEHPFYAARLNNLAILFDNMGQNEKALLLYEQAITIRKKSIRERASRVCCE